MTNTVSTQQILSQALVGALAVNIMASAMYVMMGTLSTSEFAVPMTELKGTQAAVHELKLAFGGDVVDKAVKSVGTGSMIALAQETERIIVEDMTSKYGAQATQAALATAPLGDVTTAREIASALAGRGVKPQNMETWLKTAPVQQKTQVVEGAKKRVKMKAKPTKDTKTGITYKSHAAAGMAVAAEYNLDPTDTYVWFSVIQKDPTRFKEIGAFIPPKASSLTAVQKVPVSGAGGYTEEQKAHLIELSGITPHEMTEAEGIEEEYRSKGYRVVHPEAAGPSMTWTTEGKQAMVNRVLPEWKRVLDDMSMVDIPGNKLKKPKKFVEKIEIIQTPAGFNPSAQGGYAFTNSYSWDGENLMKGPSYTYESMMNVVGSPYERAVDVPRGTRVWVCTYDGQWGGYWSRVDVYVHADDLISSPGLKLLQEGKMHGET